MDPHATWHEMLNAMIDGDYANASEHADNLCNWIEKGGFFEMKVAGRKMDQSDLKEILNTMRCGINWIEARS